VSTIVSPYPPADAAGVAAPAEASWWRLRLEPNADGHTVVVRTNAKDGDLSTATWCSWEIFDGHSAHVDAGLDRPTLVRLTYLPGGRHFVDVLHIGPPTPAEWVRLTDAGVFVHPDDRDGVV